MQEMAWGRGVQEGCGLTGNTSDCAMYSNSLSSFTTRATACATCVQHMPHVVGLHITQAWHHMQQDRAIPASFGDCSHARPDQVKSKHTSRRLSSSQAAGNWRCKCISKSALAVGTGTCTAFGREQIYTLLGNQCLCIKHVPYEMMH